jgi:hypothetical protein
MQPFRRRTAAIGGGGPPWRGQQEPLTAPARREAARFNPNRIEPAYRSRAGSQLLMRLCSSASSMSQ